MIKTRALFYGLVTNLPFLPGTFPEGMRGNPSGLQKNFEGELLPYMMVLKSQFSMQSRV